MTERIAYLEAVIGADITSFRRGMQEVRRETGILSDTMQGLGHVGRNMTLAVTTPIMAMGYSAIQAAGSFDAAMRNINSITFLTEDGLKALSERTLEFGASIRSGPQSAAEALYTVFSAGITDVDTAFNTMKVGARTAEAGLADLTKTTEGLVAAALTFGDQSPAALQRYSDAVTLAVQLGVGSMDTFNTGFANVMGTSAAVGQSFEEMAAMTAFLSQRGVQAGAAGTYLNNALTKLIKPTEDMTALFDKLGVKSGKELISTFGGFVPALRAIYKELGANEAQWAKIFNDVRGFKAVSRIFTAFEEDGTDAVSEFFNTFDQKMAEGGITMSAWEQQMMSFEAQWGLLTSAIQGFAIMIGNVLLPIVTPMIEWFTALLVQVQTADPMLIKLGVTFAGLVAATGPLLWLFASLVSPIGVLIGLAGALAVAFATNWNGIRDSVTKAINDILGPLDDLKTGMETFITTLFGDGTDPVQAAADKVAGTNSAVTTPVTFELLPSYDPKFRGIADLAKANNVTVDDILKALGVGSLKEAMSAAPGVYTLDIQIEPNVSLKQTTDNPLAGSKSIWEDADNAIQPQQDNTIGGRLAAAFDKAWPLIQPALDRMLGNIKTWVTTTLLPGIDLAGADVLGSISGWFDAGADENGATPVYDALHTMLNGGIAKAASGFVADVQKNFPGIRDGLNTLLANIGTWVTEEGVPTVARAGGYLVGRLAAGMGAALSGLWQTISGQNPDAGPAVEGVKSFAEDTAEAWRFGWDDAMRDAGVGQQGGLQGFVDQTFTGLAGVLTVGAGGAFLATLISKGFPAAIGATLTTALGLAKGFFAVGNAVLDGVLGLVANQLINRLPNTTAFNTIGTGLLDLIGAKMGKATPTQGAFASAASNLINSFKTALGGMTLPTLALVVGTIALAATAVTVAADSGLFNPVGHGFKMAIDPASIEWTEGTNLVDTMLKNAIPNNNGTYVVDLPWPVLASISDLQFDMAGLDKDKVISVMTLPEDVKQSYLDTWKTLATEAQSAFTEAMAAGPVTEAPPQTNFELGGENNAVGVKPLFLANMVPTTEDVQTQLVDPLTSNISVAIAGAASAGNFDGTPIADSLVKPITDAFTLAFGTEGTVTLKWTEFINSYLTNATTMLTKISTVRTNVVLLKDVMVSAFTIMRNKVIELVGEIGSHIASLSSTISAVGDAAGAAAGVSGVTPKGGPMPERASGGPAEGWTMVGERGPEAVYFGSKGMVFPARMLRGAGGGGETVVNNIQINGVQDVDGLLFELERRGIVIA